MLEAVDCCDGAWIASDEWPLWWPPLLWSQFVLSPNITTDWSYVGFELSVS